MDDVESDLAQPIVSVSLGCPALFLMGGRTKATHPSALLLRGGDVLVLAGQARSCYHGARACAGKRQAHVYARARWMTANVLWGETTPARCPASRRPRAGRSTPCSRAAHAKFNPPCGHGLSLGGREGKRRALSCPASMAVCSPSASSNRLLTVSTSINPIKTN